MWRIGEEYFNLQILVWFFIQCSLQHHDLLGQIKPGTGDVEGRNDVGATNSTPSPEPQLEGVVQPAFTPVYYWRHIWIFQLEYTSWQAPAT